MALERRIGAVLGMAYVDDFITMEVVLGEFSARNFFVGASYVHGAVFGEHRTSWPFSQASCLGVHVRLAEVGSSRITFEPVSGTLERLAQEVQARLTQGTCTSAQAVKLRGRAGDGGLCSSGRTCAGSFEMENTTDMKNENKMKKSTHTHF